jgi:NADPH:quinone reductase-like Zn-dependent oxidoreductase
MYSNTRLAVFPLACMAAAAVAATPGKMRAAVMESRSWDFKFHLEKVEVIDLDVPTPGHGEVLVQVRASNINPVDHKIVEMAGVIWSYPHQLGSDLAGVVTAVGPGCQRLKVGDEVWGEATTLLEAIHSGATYAEYAAVSESVLGLKPKALNMTEAGSMPMVALTGYDSLSWSAQASRFQGDNVTVLVLGGSGGTGHLGIQLAKAMGAKEVITTCSGAHADFVKSLGADRVIDYHKENFYDVIPARSVDVVYDCVGLSGTGDNASALIKQHGSFISLLQSGMPSMSTKFHRPDLRTYAPLCVGGCSHYDRIDAVAALVDAGKLKVHIDVTYDLEQIQQAFNHSIQGHTTGKVAVEMRHGHPEVTIV